MGTKNYSHIKNYGPFKGLNAGVSDFNLPDGFFSTAKNATIQPGSTALASRPGYKPHSFDPSLSKRRFFIGLYVNTNTDTGEQTEEELFFNITDFTAETVVKNVFTISNTSGTDVNAEINFNDSTSLWRFQLTNASTEAVIQSVNLDSSAGVPSVTVSNLMTTINGYSGFTITNTTGGATTGLASVVFPACKVSIPTGTSRTFVGYINKTIPVSSDLVTEFSPINNASSYTNINNCLFFTIPSIGLCKYDGQTVTRAGMPVPDTFTQLLTINSGAGNLGEGQYVYALAFEAIDAKGNVHEGLGECSRAETSGVKAASGNDQKLGPGIKAITGVSAPCDVRASFNIPDNFDQFELRGASVNGSQTIDAGNLILTVDSTHTLNVGDRICAKVRINPVSTTESTYFVTALITATTSTTITLSSSDWSVMNIDPQGKLALDVKTSRYFVDRFVDQTGLTIAEIDAWVDGGTDSINFINNSYISNNIRANIYRSKGTGVTLADGEYPLQYLNTIIPVPFDSTLTSYDDDTLDENLGPLWEQKIEIGQVPFKNTDGLSPDVSIVCNHQGRLYLAGNPEAVNTLYRSDILFGPEFYNPFGFLDLNLETGIASKITAIGSTSDNLVVGKTRGIKLISGDLSTDTNIRIDDISFDLGLVNQASTVSAIGKCIGLTQLGPVEIDSQGQLQFIGSQELAGKSRLEGVLKNNNLALDFSAAVVNMEKGYYAFYLPNRGLTGSTQVNNNSYLQFNQGSNFNSNTSFGSLYVYLITQDAWFQWERFDATGGAYIKDGLLHAVRTGSLGSVILRENASGTLSDYVDWYQAINLDVATNWIDLQEPYLFKQFIRALIQNVEKDPLSVNDYSIEIIAEKDWVSDVSQSAVTISDLEKVGYGQMKIRGNKSRSMRIRLKSSILKQRPIITGLTIEISAPFRPKIKQE